MDNPNLELQELHDDLIKIGTAVKEYRENVNGQLGDHSGRIDELHKSVDEFVAVSKRIQAIEGTMEKMAEHGDKLEAMYGELAEFRGEKPDAQGEEHMAMFQRYMNTPSDPEVRQYFSGLTADMKTRGIIGSNFVEGGALVPAVLEAGILKNVVESSPVLQVAGSTTIIGERWEKIKQTSGMTGYWVGEEERPTETAIKWDMIRITPGTVGAATQVSRYMLENASVDLEGEIAAEAATAISVKLNTALVTGDGAGKPRGFTIPGDVPYVDATDTSTYNIGPLDFPKMLYGKGGTDNTGLSSLYRANASWAMNSNTFLAVSLLLDSQNRPLFLDNYAQPPFARILNKPINFFEDMADDGTDGNLAVALADWSRFYKVVYRAGMYMLRDPYSAKPSTELDWYLDVGGDVILPEAGRLLAM